jgi:hypothetical protein
MQIDHERLAYWYLRLNGFLTIENFIVHDEGGGPQRTDADLVAIRLPHRQEGYHLSWGTSVWMEDDPRFSKKELPFAAFVEVATDRCKLNGPWTDPKKGNMERALNALGALPFADNKKAAAAMYEKGSYRSASIELGLISIGTAINRTRTRKMPNVMQITWDEVKQFIFARFDRWEAAKRRHPQWDPDGHRLWRSFCENRDDVNRFASSIVFSRNWTSRRSRPSE